MYNYNSFILKYSVCVNTQLWISELVKSLQNSDFKKVIIIFRIKYALGEPQKMSFSILKSDLKTDSDIQNISGSF